MIIVDKEASQKIKVIDKKQDLTDLKYQLNMGPNLATTVDKECYHNTNLKKEINRQFPDRENKLN